jgi:ubiquinone/menaquinone biosynthesis C-methylase UbiE
MNRERRPGMELPFDFPSSAVYNRISRIPIFTFERNLVMKEIKRYAPRGTLLDIGCGPGYLAAEIVRNYPELKVMGLDISQDMLDLAAKNLPANKIRLIRGDAAALPLDEASIDFVVSSVSLHHWDNPEAAFREIYRVLRPGGRFLIMDIMRNAPFLVYLFANVLNIFAPSELKRTQGARGSLYTAFTPAELAVFIAPMSFKQTSITSGFAWMFATGVK